MGDDGLIEPVIVQIKDSLRTSLDLDVQLAALTAIEKENGLGEVEWYAGPKLLVKLSFPKEFSDDEALKAISALQESAAVEKVVVQSAANLEFKSADFVRSWKVGQTIPDASRRGFDVDRLKRPSITYDEETKLVPHSANRIIVRWKDEYVWDGGRKDLEQQFAVFNAQAECSLVGERRYTDHDLTQTLEFDAAKYSVLDQLLLYQLNEMVDYVQPDYLYELTSVPNDPVYNTYQKVYPLGKISAESAWDSTIGSNSTVVAVLDTGANVASTNGHVAHPDMTANLWSGQNNGDKHNFTLDGHGPTDVYDYVAGSLYSHGMNVASIIGARGDNGLYMCGLSRNVALMILKVLPVPGNNTPNGNTAEIAEAIDYAVAHGARAMNLSFGQYFCTAWTYDPEFQEYTCTQYGLDLTLRDAIRNARDTGVGVVVVCGAGNGGGNNDIGNPFTPANIPTENLISVAASDQSDARATFSVGSSNFGAKTVDLAAPGKNIYGLRQSFNGNSNDPANYVPFEGTSQAAPHATGTIALLAAKYGWENAHGLRDRVLMGTDDLTDPSWTSHDVRTHGRLNANKALHARTLIRNLSARARVESGNNIMIGGFIIGGSGTGTLKVALRGLGPSLAGLTVAKLADPKITLYNSAGTMLRQVLGSTRITDIPAAEWDELNADGLIPGNTKEPAMIMTLAPGAYSLFVESQTGTAGWGVGLFEIYELEGGLDEQTRLLNVSTRCLVRTGEEVAIAGTILGDPTQGGNTTIPKRSILMFGKGPSLGISGNLANPYLTLKNSTGTTLGTNDSWGGLGKPLDELVEQNLDPTSSVESALWPILTSGSYTVTMNGVSNGTGVGLLELYEY